MHCGIHVNRCEGGIQPGSTVGVLLDLERHQLSFYVNEEPQVRILILRLFSFFFSDSKINFRFC